MTGVSILRDRQSSGGWDRRAGERGQVLILVALSLVGLLGFLALVVDVGFLYAERAKAMNAAEAATTAGVQSLPADPISARAAALEYAARNGISSERTTVTVSLDNTRLDVAVRSDAPLFFARVFGLETVEVSGKAAAVVSAVRSLRGAKPLGVEEQQFIYGATYYLKNSPGYGGSYKGNFGALALGGHGGANYRDNLEHGYPGELKLGDVVESEPGNMSGPTSQGLGALIDADPTGTYDNHDPGSPRIIKVPVVRWSDGGGGRSDATVVGFAAFWLESVGGSGRENYVTGRFMQMLTSNEVGEAGSGDDSAYDFGLYSYRLVE